MRTLTGAAQLLAAACLLTSCTRFQIFELPPQPAHSRPNMQENSGLLVAAEVLTDPNLIAYHFSPEICDSAYIPVWVDLETKGANAFQIKRQDFRMVLENGEQLEAASPKEVFANCKRSHLRTILLAPLIIPSFIAYMNINKYNLELARILYERGFPGSLRLEGGDPPCRMTLFFRDPRVGARSGHEFQSSVLQFTAEVEGARSEPSVEGVTFASAQRPVGRPLTFTVALSGEHR